MKKVLFILILLSISYPCYQANSGLISILKKSGGELGPDNITRYKDVIVVKAYLFDYVSCTGAGNSTCPEEVVIDGANSKQLKAANEAREFAKYKIESNILEGQEDLPSGLTVKWRSQTNNFNQCGECEIKVWETGEPEPSYTY